MNVRNSLGLVAAGLLTAGLAQTALADDVYVINSDYGCVPDYGYVRVGCDAPVYYYDAAPVRYYNAERYYYAPQPVVYHRTRVYRSRTYYAPPPVTYHNYRYRGHDGRGFGGSFQYHGNRGGFRAGFHYNRR